MTAPAAVTSPIGRSGQNVVVMAHGSGRGGAEHCLDTTLRHLDLTQWHVTVMFPTAGPMVDSARALGMGVEIRTQVWWMAIVPSLWYARQLLSAPFRIIALARRLRRQRVDLVYTNTAVIPEGALAAWLAGIPHVWHVHEVLTPAHMRPSLLPVERVARLIARLSRRVVFESHSARAICASTVPDAKARVVYNSLRALREEGAVSREEARVALSIPPAEFVIAWIGRFSERKQPLLLIDALARMTHRNRTTLLFVGQGPLEGAMLEKRRSLGLDESRCRILPFRDDLGPIFRAADALALTSSEESFGLVLIEAGAFTLPTVATRAQGPAEIIVEGETGFVVDIGDSAALAERLDRLAADPALRRTLGVAAADRVATQFSAAGNTARLEEVFREAIG